MLSEKKRYKQFFIVHKHKPLTHSDVNNGVAPKAGIKLVEPRSALDLPSAQPDAPYQTYLQAHGAFMAAVKKDEEAAAAEKAVAERAAAARAAASGGQRFVQLTAMGAVSAVAKAGVVPLQQHK